LSFRALLFDISYKFLASEHDSVGILTKKSKMAEISDKGWRKIQNGGQKSRWRRVDFF
jgi:hypothetical protein